MWLVYLKCLYDGSTLVKVLVWLFILYLIGGLLYQAWGWAGVIIPLAVIIALIAFWLMPNKDQRRHRKLREERERLNKEIMVMHPHTTIIGEVENGYYLPRVYELEIVESPDVNDQMFDVYFKLLSDFKGIEVKVCNKSSSEIKVSWGAVKIDNFETYVHDEKINKPLEKVSIAPKGTNVMCVFRKMDVSYLYGRKPPSFFTVNKKFNVKMSISSPNTRKTSYIYTMVVRDLTQKRIEAMQETTDHNELEIKG